MGFGAEEGHGALLDASHATSHEWLSFPRILYWMLPLMLVLLILVAVVVRVCSRRNGYQRIDEEVCFFFFLAKKIFITILAAVS
jgi:hypothetical protein